MIGKYAAENGNAATVKHFKASHNIGESTVRSFKIKYLQEIEKNRKSGNASSSVTKIGTKKRGRPLTLGELDKEVQQYILALHPAAAPVNGETVIPTAEGIVIARDRSLLC